jgi:hypothetical protein
VTQNPERQLAGSFTGPQFVGLQGLFGGLHAQLYRFFGTAGAERETQPAFSYQTILETL